MNVRVVLAVACVAAFGGLGCGDDTGGGSGGGDSGQTTGTGSQTGSATGATTGGRTVTNCTQLCALEPTATTSEKNCVAGHVSGLHPTVATTPACAAINSPEDCLACYAAASVPDGTCASAHTACF